MSYHVIPSGALLSNQLTNGQQLATQLAGAAALVVQVIWYASVMGGTQERVLLPHLAHFYIPRHWTRRCQPGCDRPSQQHILCHCGSALCDTETATWLRQCTAPQSGKFFTEEALMHTMHTMIVSTTSFQQLPSRGATPNSCSRRQEGKPAGCSAM